MAIQTPCLEYSSRGVSWPFPLRHEIECGHNLQRLINAWPSQAGAHATSTVPAMGSRAIMRHWSWLIMWPCLRSPILIPSKSHGASVSFRRPSCLGESVALLSQTTTFLGNHTWLHDDGTKPRKMPILLTLALTAISRIWPVPSFECRFRGHLNDTPALCRVRGP